MRARPVLLVAMVGLLCASACVATSEGRKVLRAKQTSRAPLIDGDLSDAVWRQAGLTGGFLNEEGGGPASEPTLVYALSDLDHLYLAFRCAEPEPARMLAYVNFDNANVWGDDCVEMNFDPAGGMQDIYQLTVNSIGTKELELRGYGHVCLTAVQAAARVQQEHWTAEIALPFAALGITRSAGVEMHWRVNFERLRTIGGEEDDYWQDTYGDWANPATYGELIIPGGPLVIEGLGHPPLKAGWLSGALARLSNRSSKPCQVEVVVADLTAAEQKAGCALSVPPHRSAYANLDFPVNRGGERAYRWLVRDRASGALLYSLDRVFKVKKAIEADLFYHSGEVMVEVDTAPWGKLPAEANFEVQLLPAGGGTPFCVADAKMLDEEGAAEALLKVGNLPGGQYEVRATARDRAGRALGSALTETLNWPGNLNWPRAPQGLKVLNNFVTELLNVEPASAPARDYTFFNPRDGWIFIAATSQVGNAGEVRLTLDASPPEAAVIVQAAGAAPVAETMRELPAGEHALHVWCKGESRLQRLVVRAVPELEYVGYPGNPQLAHYGPYDWEFLARHVLPHVNTIMGSPTGEGLALAQQWRERGGKWLLHCGVPGMHGPDITPEYAEQEWLKSSREGDFVADGIMVDEFFAEYNRNYPAWTGAVQRLQRNPAFRGVEFFPYCNSMYEGERSTEFIRAVMEGAGGIAWIRYFGEQPRELQARRLLRSKLTQEMLQWEKALPGSTRRTVVVFSWLCAPPQTMNVNPGVDYKTWMDMQFRWVANDPAFWGVFGVQEFASAYADEESVRWAARLYRHYCIEGNTEPLTHDPYILTHLENPDFADGLQGWNVEAAERDSISAGSLPGSVPLSGYSWLQGRFSDNHEGDTFLLMRRSRQRPNVVWQTVKGLEPGRLYSLKMITGDHQDLSVRQEHAVSIELAGVEWLSEKSFEEPFASPGAPAWGGYDRSRPAWMNFHWRVFRATSREALLRISDWLNENEPGGPIGQELMYNFTEVQPYLEE